MSGAEAHQQYVMICRVEGGGQVREGENGNLSLVRLNLVLSVMILLLLR